jgi:hypothetical protein
MLIIQQLGYEKEGKFGELGRYDSEEGIISGEEELLSLLPREEWQAHSEERLMGMMNGPRVIAGQIENENNDDNAVRSDDIEMTEQSTEIPTSEDEAEISLSELNERVSDS